MNQATKNQVETMLAEIAPKIVRKAIKTNKTFASVKVNFLFRDHHVDLADGTYGVAALIRRILREHGAIFPMGSEQTNMRNVVVAGSMFLSEIESEIRSAFGNDRYPTASIRTHLCQKMEDVQSVQLTSMEDASGKKPRAKYFLTE